MKTIIRIGCRVTFILFVLLFVSKGKAMASELNVKVDPIFGENQVDNNRSHYEILTKPGKHEKLSFKLTNVTNEKRTIALSVNAATTDSSGAVNYTKHVKKTKGDANSSMQDVAFYPKEVELEAKESKVVTLSLELPEKEFVGVMLGGLLVSESDKTNEGQTDETLQIINKFSYAVPIMLYESDQQTKANLELLRVEPTTVNAHNALNIQVKNPVSSLLPIEKTEVKITKKNSQKVLKESKKEQTEFAPNSTWDYMIDWDNKEFKPGKYVAHVRIDSQYGQWKWDEDFEITAKKAKEINEKAIEVDKDYSFYILMGIVVIAGMLLVIIVLLVKKKKQEPFKTMT